MWGSISDSRSSFPVRYLRIIPSLAHTRTNQLPLVDTTGRPRIRSLFFETFGTGLDTSIYYPLWTLKNRPLTLTAEYLIYNPERENTLPPLRDVYLKYNDPTEFSFAMAVFGEWEHWSRVAESEKVLPFVTKWREELKLRMESEAFDTARRVAQYEQGAVALQAAKWLHSAIQKKDGRGRPSKAEVAKAAKALAEQAKDDSDASKRIGLPIVEGLSDNELQILEDI